MSQHDQPIKENAYIESLSEQERINKLREVMKPLWKPGFSTAAHGTSMHVADFIITNGLRANVFLLDSTAIPLLTGAASYEEEPDSVFKQVLHWQHRDYKCIIIIQIPNPDPAKNEGGMNYFNRILEELPDDKKIKEGIPGVDVSYVIQPKFIQGYINVENLSFVKNPAYDESAKIPPPKAPKEWAEHIPLNENASEKPKLESGQTVATNNFDPTDPNNWVW